MAHIIYPLTAIDVYCSEGLLLELAPSLDKQTVKRIARKLASLRPFQSLVRHKRSGRKEYLKKLARELIGNMQQEQKVSSSSATVTREVSDDEEVSTTRLNCGSRVDRHHLLINRVGEKKYNDILSVSSKLRLGILLIICLSAAMYTTSLLIFCVCVASLFHYCVAYR